MITIEVKDELLQRITALAGVSGVSPNLLAQRAIEAGVSKFEQFGFAQVSRPVAVTVCESRRERLGKFIAENWQKMDDRVLAQSFGEKWVSWSVVLRLRLKLGFRRTNVGLSRKIIPDEFFRIRFGKITQEQMAEESGLGIRTVYQRLVRLGLLKTQPRTTRGRGRRKIPIPEEYLRDNWEKLTYRQMAAAQNVSVPTIVRWGVSLGLLSQKPIEG